MDSIFYQPSEAWVGDVIPFFHKGTYYLYYLHDPRKVPDRFAENTTWHLVTTDDFVHFDYKGISLFPGGLDKSNRDIFTGSVIQDANGRFHAFYTGFNENIQVDGRPIQVVMKAVSDDLLSWQTEEDFILRPDQSRYGLYDWRDPYVFWNDRDQSYWMLVTTRLKDYPLKQGGCIGLCKSIDLRNWQYCDAFYNPTMYETLECPEVFQEGEWWYLVFSTFTDRFTTHYRMARDLAGPWVIPEQDTFDARACYAIKTASDGLKRFGFGWIPTKSGFSDWGQWDWGGTLVIHEIFADPDSGILKVRKPESYSISTPAKSVLELASVSHCIVERVGPKVILKTENMGGALLAEINSDFRFACKLDILTPNSGFGLAIHTDKNFEDGYFFKFDIKHNRIAFDLWPRQNQGNYQWQKGGDRPFLVELERYLPLKVGQSLEIVVVKNDSACVLYVNDEIALSTRMYNHRGGYIGIYVIQGQLGLEQYQLEH